MIWLSKDVTYSRRPETEATQKPQFDMKTTLTVIAFSMVSSCLAQERPGREIQIKTAVLAAPQDQRDGATVMAQSPEGGLVVLRKGTNSMICLADDPDKPGLNV